MKCTVQEYQRALIDVGRHAARVNTLANRLARPETRLSIRETARLICELMQAVKDLGAAIDVLSGPIVV